MADFDSDTPVGVVGAGTMGAGIAQVAALGGHHIRIHDTIPGAADEAIRRIQQRLARLTDKGRLDPTRARAAGDRLSVAGSVTELQDCGLVIEAVAEELAAKRETFSTLEAVCPPETILATNTSSLSVTDIAANLEHPNRVAGLHFFNPAPLLPLVEVVHGEASDKDVIDTLVGAVRAWGKTPV
ncbi:MAG: 3-hydroxyacyl-CoA dehydrogenase NAD-binding domain-containing protein, partial [Actinomycetota bacterium]